MNEAMRGEVVDSEAWLRRGLVTVVTIGLCEL